MQKTWFVTGASRGFGAEIAKAALRSGDRVVATARKRGALVERLGPDSGQLILPHLHKIPDTSERHRGCFEFCVSAESPRMEDRWHLTMTSSTNS